MLCIEHNITIEEWGLGYRATEIIFRNNNILKPVFSSILEGKEKYFKEKAADD